MKRMMMVEFKCVKCKGKKNGKGNNIYKGNGKCVNCYYNDIYHARNAKKTKSEKQNKPTVGKLCKKKDWRKEGRELTREKIRVRDNHTCQHCGKKWEEGKRRFDVHHLDEVKEKSRQYDVYEKEKDNLITLCHKCHLNIPGHKEKMSKAHRKPKTIVPCSICGGKQLAKGLCAKHYQQQRKEKINNLAGLYTGKKKAS